jgi:hypothetical protein
MEIPERAVKSWRCNANAASGASPAPVTTSADQEKKLPAAKPERALSAIKIEIEIMNPPGPPEDWNHSWANHGAHSKLRTGRRKISGCCIMGTHGEGLSQPQSARRMNSSLVGWPRHLPRTSSDGGRTPPSIRRPRGALISALSTRCGARVRRTRAGNHRAPRARRDASKRMAPPNHPDQPADRRAAVGDTGGVEPQRRARTDRSYMALAAPAEAAGARSSRGEV